MNVSDYAGSFSANTCDFALAVCEFHQPFQVKILSQHMCDDENIFWVFLCFLYSSKFWEELEAT